MDAKDPISGCNNALSQVRFIPNVPRIQSKSEDIVINSFNEVHGPIKRADESVSVHQNWAERLEHYADANISGMARQIPVRLYSVFVGFAKVNLRGGTSDG